VQMSIVGRWCEGGGGGDEAGECRCKGCVSYQKSGFNLANLILI
jgi:hypothetical protein